MAASYTSVHQLYAAATSTGGDSVASMVIPVSGRIVQVQLQFYGATAAAISRVEASLQSTNQFTTNDARQVLATVLDDVATGAAAKTIVLCDVPVTEMDRVYVHVQCTSAAWRMVGLVWLRH